MAFYPNQQKRLLLNQPFNALEVFSNSLAIKPPWDSIIEFSTSDKFCNQKLYPRQQTLLRLIYLETEQMTTYDIDVIEEWREGFKSRRDVYGVQPDIWERVKYLKAHGYSHFPHVQSVLGRRASKGFIGGILGAERFAYMYSLDSWQHHFDLSPGAVGWCQIIATSQSQSKRTQFADIRYIVENCKYLQKAISESKESEFAIRTPADLRQIAEMQAKKITIEHPIASLRAIAQSANSATTRGVSTFCMCLDPETPVLTADLRWVPIKSVLPGDELVGVDEYPAPGLHRKARKTIVKSKWSTVKEAYKIIFDDGSAVVCSGDHRWLCRAQSGSRRYSWRKTKVDSAYHSMKPGTEIVQLVEPWEEDDSRGAGYLAGIYDGEGHLSKQSIGNGIGVFFTQNPGAVTDFTLNLLKERGFGAGLESRRTGAQQWCVRGMASTLRLLGQIRPQRLLSGAATAYDGISINGSKVRTVVSIDLLPEQELIDIETTTSTFIANGLVSHNCYDEMAHMIFGSGSTKSGEEIYEAAQPSLSQFRGDQLTYIPSSPFSKIGKFFELYTTGSILVPSYHDGQESKVDVEAEIDDYTADPEMLIVQLASWGLYEDWERSVSLGGPKFKRAVEQFDDRMRRLQQRNPEKFSVERLGQFAEVEGAYLDRNKVDEIFDPPGWRPDLGPEEYGILNRRYVIHADPGRTNANFAIAIGHLEDAPADEYGLVWPHVILDYLNVWKPQDYADHTIDYREVKLAIMDILKKFNSTEKISFDQWNSASMIADIKYEFSPRIRVVQENFTMQANQSRFEKFKSAINLGWLHGYRDTFGDAQTCLLEQELKFLSEVNGKVDKQSFGPITTKDLADCVMVVTTSLLHAALDQWVARLGVNSSFGSTDVAGMRHGREFERLAELGMGERKLSKARQQLVTNKIDRLRGQRQGDYLNPLRGRKR